MGHLACRARFAVEWLNCSPQTSLIGRVRQTRLEAGGESKLDQLQLLNG